MCILIIMILALILYPEWRLIFTLTLGNIRCYGKNTHFQLSLLPVIWSIVNHLFHDNNFHVTPYWNLSGFFPAKFLPISWHRNLYCFCSVCNLIWNHWCFCSVWFWNWDYWWDIWLQISISWPWNAFDPRTDSASGSGSLLRVCRVHFFQKGVLKMVGTAYALQH